MSSLLKTIDASLKKETDAVAKVTVVEKPKAKKKNPNAGCCIGTEVGKFSGWRVSEKSLEYGNEKSDRKAFDYAVKMGLLNGAVVNGNYKSDAGTFWKTNCNEVPPKDKGIVVNAKGFVAIGSHIVFPFVGGVLTVDELDRMRSVVNKLEYSKFGTTGVNGKVALAATAVCSVYTSWVDFLYAYLLYGKDKQFSFFVDKSSTTRFNLIRDLPLFKNISVACASSPPPPTEAVTPIIFINSLDKTFLSRINAGWTPFATGVASDAYFCGTGGLYPFGKCLRTPLGFSEHERMILNYMGLLMFYNINCVPLVDSVLFNEALTRKSSNVGVAQVRLGMKSLGLNDDIGGEKIDKSDWIYDCELHSEKVHPTIKPFALQCAGEQKGSEAAPLMFKHNKQNVVSAYTEYLWWDDLAEGATGFAWKSSCLKCNETYYMDPNQLIDTSLSQPKPVVRVGAVKEAPKMVTQRAAVKAAPPKMVMTRVPAPAVPAAPPEEQEVHADFDQPDEQGENAQEGGDGADAVEGLAAIGDDDFVIQHLNVIGWRDELAPLAVFRYKDVPVSETNCAIRIGPDYTVKVARAPVDDGLYIDDRFKLGSDHEVTVNLAESATSNFTINQNGKHFHVVNGIQGWFVVNGCGVQFRVIANNTKQAKIIVDNLLVTLPVAKMMVFLHCLGNTLLQF
jgi:hypothetical protein